MIIISLMTFAMNVFLFEFNSAHNIVSEIKTYSYMKNVNFTFTFFINP